MCIGFQLSARTLAHAEHFSHSCCCPDMTEMGWGGRQAPSPCTSHGPQSEQVAQELLEQSHCEWGALEHAAAQPAPRKEDFTKALAPALC